MKELYLSHYGKKGMKWRKKKRKEGDSWVEYIANQDLSWSDPFGTKARRKKKLKANAKEAHRRMKAWGNKMETLSIAYNARQAKKFLNRLGGGF